MRIHGRHSNPLLRRVQRHTRISTLFRAEPAELSAVESGGGQVQARPVQAMLLPVQVEPVPLIAPAPLSSLPPAPTAAPLQTYPAAPVVSTVPAGRIPQVQPPAAYSPVTLPSSSAPSVPAPQTDPVKAEEDRNWKRLQTIMRKHAEKEEVLQPQTDEQTPAVAGEPQTMAPPIAISRETPPKPAAVPLSEPVQRRTSVVEELPVALGAHPVGGAPPAVHEGRIAPAPVPSLLEFGSAEEAASPGRPQSVPAAAVAASLPGERQPEPAPVSPAPVSPLPQQSQVKAQGMLPENAAISEALATGQVSPVMRQVEADVTAVPMKIAEQPAVPIQRELAMKEAKLSEELPQPESLPPTAAGEAPTVQMSRASLMAKQPVQSGQISLPQVPVAAEALPPVQHTPAELIRSHAPVIQRQPESSAAAAEPPIPPALLEPDQPPPPLVKASLAGPQPIRRAPEMVSASQPDAPVAQPASPVVRHPAAPLAAEPPPGYIVSSFTPAAPASTAPLESIWPVQRLPGAAEPPRAAPADVTGREMPALLPHDEHLGQILQSVAPGLPSDSSVELVTPRKPRPASVVKPSASNPKLAPVSVAPSVEVGQAAPPLQRLEVPAEPFVTPAVLVEPAKEPLPSVELPRQVASLPPEIKPVPTEIGPLPSDLWGLIGQPVPETPQAPEKLAPARPARQSTLQRHVEEKEPVQRTVTQPGTEQVKSAPAKTPVESPQPGLSEPLPEATGGDEAGEYSETAEFSADMLAPEAPEDVIQRSLVVGEIASELEATPEENQPGSSAPNVEELAQRVYHEIRRRLSVEFERWRRSG